MKLCKWICGCVCLSLAGVALAAPPAPATQPPHISTFGITKGIPVYLQEFHIWWGFAYPNPQYAVSHIESTYCSFREPWRLEWNCNGYPMVGLYDSHNLDIVRWQLRCIKATGVTAVAIQLHPVIGEGLHFIQERGGFISQILKIAAQVKMPVFFMDEVAFRPDAQSRDPKIMAQRIIRFLKRYASSPGFYKINGAPVYYYQTFGYWVGVKKTSQMMREVEAAVGPVYWMIFGDVAQVGRVPQVKAIVCGNNLARCNPTTRKTDFDSTEPGYIFNLGHKFHKLIGDLHYPKFDDSSQPWRRAWVSQYGHQGAFLKATVANSMKYHPDFLMLSSWNDYEEGAYFEPAWDFDGFTGDPYLYCRVLAGLRGIKFVPPPLPPKQALHPTIWEKLGYGDGAGPIIDHIYRSHVRGGSLEVVVRDTASAVAGLEVVPDGDAWWAAPQPGQDGPTGSLKLCFGEVGKPQEVSDHMGHTVGQACNTGLGKLRFELTTDPARLGDQPFVGVAYATDPMDPTRPVHVLLPRQTPAPTMEPVGGFQTHDILPMSPPCQAQEIGTQAWAGWQTGVAYAYAPVNLKPPQHEITLDAPGCNLALISLLGPPRPDRILTTPSVKHDAQGRCVSYYITLGAEQLDHPGVHFIWFRAKDSVGNWGSPRLYAVPNYERPATRPAH